MSSKSTELEDRLTAELNRRSFWMRFAPELESRFVAESIENARTPRIILLILGTIMIAITPLYDSWLLEVPAEFKRISNFIQIQIEVLAILIAVIVVVSRRLNRFAQPIIFIVSTIVALGLIAQRYFGAMYGFSVPHEFPALVIAAVIVLGRISIWSYLPWVLFIVLAMAGAEVAAYGATGESWYRIISVVMLVTLLVTGAIIGSFYVRTNWLQTQLLSERSTVDALTGLCNRRQFEVSCERVVRQAIREQRPMAMVMLDIDHFKKYNDEYGHVAGDACLRKLGQYLSRGTRRPMDVCARFGGEEFVAVYYDMDRDYMLTAARELLADIQALNIEHRTSPTADTVTASAGLLYVTPQPDDTLDSLLRDCDKLLYKAKRNGRNRLETNISTA